MLLLLLLLLLRLLLLLLLLRVTLKVLPTSRLLLLLLLLLLVEACPQPCTTPRWLRPATAAAAAPHRTAVRWCAMCRRQQVRVLGRHAPREARKRRPMCLGLARGDKRGCQCRGVWIAINHWPRLHSGLDALHKRSNVEPRHVRCSAGNGCPVLLLDHLQRTALGVGTGLVPAVPACALRTDALALPCACPSADAGGGRASRCFAC